MKPISEWLYSKDVLLKKEETKQKKHLCEMKVGILHGWNNQNKKKISLGSILLLLAILGYNIKIVDIIAILSKIL